LIPRSSIGSISEADNLVLRAVSIALLVGAWYLGSELAGERMLPGPVSVIAAILAEAGSGTLFMDLGVTLARVTLAFLLALAAGAAIGLVMGRVVLADRLGDPWLVLLLNLPALVIIVLAYIWGGLTEAAVIAAVAANKLPNTIVTVREGARALDPALDEMARVFAIPTWRVLRHVVLPQLGPYLAAAARSGLSLVWKIGFEIGIAFQLFDVTRLLAYALVFVALMLLIETMLVQPLERRASRWRRRTA
jgi:NitT/TauT family transport system permease protein